MIVVIADDLTGAVELGGIGLNYGLQIQVNLGEISSADSIDLLIVSTDTRSGTQQEAVEVTKKVCSKLKNIKAELVYKKIDSALRGYIVPETHAHLGTMKLEKALLIPANPAAGRTIQNGKYFIHGNPINETGFRDDPEFPAISAEVQGLLKSPLVKVKKTSESLENGITVAETTTENDLNNWLAKLNPEVLIGGGAAFFRAIMNQLYALGKKDEKPIDSLQGNILLVSGTAYNESVALISSFNERNAVIYLPESLLKESLDEGVAEDWISKVADKIKAEQFAIIAFKPEGDDVVDAIFLRETMAELVQKVFEQVEINELIIEGGSTASAVLRALNIGAVFPVNEFAPGVVRSRSARGNNLHITLKPGSYPWSADLWKFIQRN